MTLLKKLSLGLIVFLFSSFYDQAFASARDGKVYKDFFIEELEVLEEIPSTRDFPTAPNNKLPFCYYSSAKAKNSPALQAGFYKVQSISGEINSLIQYTILLVNNFESKVICLAWPGAKEKGFGLDPEILRGALPQSIKIKKTVDGKLNIKPDASFEILSRD